jgi:CAAX prenyl protease-like protein
VTSVDRRLAAYPWAPYVVPFAMFVGLLSLRPLVPVPLLPLEIVFLAVMTLVILIVARPALDLSIHAPVSSILFGILVFVIWIAPDALFPGYRHHLENAVTGLAQSSLPLAARTSVPILALRSLRAATIVPIVEELFWRAWLMRWIISPDFRKIPLGTYTRLSFWVVAVLFASEHGAYWDVGLAAGILYNWWMIRTKSLGDLVVAHGVTNACLSAYVIVSGKWEYWM